MNSLIRATLIRPERLADRLTVGRASTLRASDGQPTDVVIEDLSSTGCKITSSFEAEVNENVVIGLPGVGTRVCQVIWSSNGQIGCAFDRPLSRLEIEETRIAQTLTHVAFPRLQTAEAPREAIPESRFPVRRSMVIILSAATAAWILTVAVAIFAYRALVT